MESWNTPAGFLKIGGIVLVLVGILGLFLLGPTSDSLLGATWYFDNAENVAHLALGVVALLLAFVVKNAMLSKWVTVGVGAFALFAAIWGVLYGTLLGAGLQTPADTILHVVVGGWALYAAFKS